MAPVAVCPDCGHECAARGLGSHRRHRHGYQTLGKRWRRVYEGPLACPECSQEFTTPQGLGAHRFRTHGIEGTSHQAEALRSRSGQFRPDAPCQAHAPIPIPGGWYMKCACGQGMTGERVYELRDALLAHVAEFHTTGTCPVLRSLHSTTPEQLLA